jgi:hypothetical protein
MEPELGVLMMRHVAVIALACALQGCGAGKDSVDPAVADASMQDLSGVWLPDSHRAEPWPADLALTPEARAVMEAFVPEQHDPTRLCMPFGTPRNMLQTEYPLEIAQTADRVMIIVQPNLANSEVRRIELNAGAPQEPVDPSWFGTSRGRWEGKSLVVETTGMRPDAPVSGNGLPHSEQLRMVERFRIENDGERGRVLVDEVELHDPRTFVAPVKVRRYFVSSPQTQLREPASCIERQWIDKTWRQRLEEHARGGRS